MVRETNQLLIGGLRKQDLNMGLLSQTPTGIRYSARKTYKAREMNHEKIIIDRQYATLIQNLKSTVQTDQLKAHRAVNTELIRMY